MVLLWAHWGELDSILPEPVQCSKPKNHTSNINFGHSNFLQIRFYIEVVVIFVVGKMINHGLKGNTVMNTWKPFSWKPTVNLSINVWGYITPPHPVLHSTHPPLPHGIPLLHGDHLPRRPVQNCSLGTAHWWIDRHHWKHYLCMRVITIPVQVYLDWKVGCSWADGPRTAWVLRPAWCRPSRTSRWGNPEASAWGRAPRGPSSPHPAWRTTRAPCRNTGTPSTSRTSVSTLQWNEKIEESRRE